MQWILINGTFNDSSIFGLLWVGDSSVGRHWYHLMIDSGYLSNTKGDGPRSVEAQRRRNGRRRNTYISKITKYRLGQTSSQMGVDPPLPLAPVLSFPVSFWETTN